MLQNETYIKALLKKNRFLKLYRQGKVRALHGSIIPQIKAFNHNHRVCARLKILRILFVSRTK